MKLNRRGALGIAAAALAVIGGGTAFAATSQVSAVPVTAATHIQNDPDSGNGGTWATDQINRALAVTLDSPQPASVPAGFLAYTATVTDAGTFTTVPGAETPNQVIPGQRISHVVSGTMAGSAAYTVLAPAADVPAAANVVANLNDNFHVPAGPQTAGQWPVQAFPAAAGVTVTLGNWSWTYVTPAGESWTDGSTTGDGNLVSDGNITGLLAPPPVVIRLSHGHGTSTAPTRETVSYQQSGAASWDEFVIIGPGAINGHKGWVHGQVGLNTGVYSGLLANHGYTSCYTVVEGQGSDVQVPGSHGGCVYFVSNR